MKRTEVHHVFWKKILLIQKPHYLFLTFLALWAGPKLVFAQCAPDLTLNKVVDPTTATVGDTLTYTITIDEVGNDCGASTVMLADSFVGDNGNLSIVSVTPSVGTCDDSGFPPNITCDFGDVALGNFPVTVTYVVDVIGADGATVTNTASVTTITNESVTTNNSDTASVLLQVATPTPVPTPPPPPPLIPDLELSGDGCSQLSQGGPVSSFLGYGLSALVLALFGVRRFRPRK